MSARKMMVVTIFILVVLILMSCSIGNQASPPPDYIIYYGTFNENIVPQLSAYKKVMIEPRHFQADQINELKQTGALIYGYMSFVEQNGNNDEFHELSENWFYKPDGKKVHNPQWDSWIMDLREPGYRAFLIKQLHKEIVDKNLDGVLIDTIGAIDDSEWSEADKAGMREAYKGLLQQIKQENSSLKLIQNWGFNTALTVSKDLIDGFMWENFIWKNIHKDEWSKKQYEAITSTSMELYVVSPKSEEGVSAPVKPNMHFFYNKNSEYNQLY
jgi:hypothetical protein